MDTLLALLPIVLLVVLLTKPNPWASHTALPVAAGVLVVIRLAAFDAELGATGATVVLGLLEALTPITIIFGAIFLFKTMELTGKMDVIRAWLNGITDSPVGQLMIIGWAFAFLIEGASGFGTPAALAAPLLVGLGFSPVRVAILTLVMNSVPVSFGAVGTPTWFGFGQLGLGEEQLLAVAFRSALLHFGIALVVPVLALSAVLPRDVIRRNIVFVYLSVLSCTVPYALLASVNYEFPALVGGAIGLGLTVWLASRRIGLERNGAEADEAGAAVGVRRGVDPRTLLVAAFPLWATIVLLVATRVYQFGIKGLLNAVEPALTLGLGGLGELSISAALVVSLREFGATGADGAWSYRALYVPALIPFFVVSFATFAIFRVEPPVVRRVVRESWDRMARPLVALLGALVLVRLLMTGGNDALVQVIGRSFADVAGEQWLWVAPFLGALGSFFSGSATISNLTFGGIQSAIASGLALDETTVLALQSVGASAGNMVCVNNIVAVCSILGIANQEGAILKRTVVPMVAYGTLAALLALLSF